MNTGFTSRGSRSKVIDDDTYDSGSGDDDPVLYEFDVFVCNPTFHDIVGDLAEEPDGIHVADELVSNPFGGLVLLQYPLEHSTFGDNQGVHSRTNATDNLPLRRVDVGEIIYCRGGGGDSNGSGVGNGTGNINGDYKQRSFGTQSVLTQTTRARECPLFRFVYDLGDASYPTFKPVLSRKQSKLLQSHYNKYHKAGDINTLDLLIENASSIGDDTREHGATREGESKCLELNSTVVTSEHATDCLGILHVTQEPNGELKRVLYLTKVKGLLQLRPRVRPEAEDDDESNAMSVPLELTHLFHVDNVHWNKIDRVSLACSPESLEIIQQLIKCCHGNTPRQYKEDFDYDDSVAFNIAFNNNRSLYVDTICGYSPPAGMINAREYDTGSDQVHRHASRMGSGDDAGIKPDDKLKDTLYDYEIDGYMYRDNLVPFRRDVWSANAKVMATLNLKMQLLLLLSHRCLDTLSSLKRSTVSSRPVDSHKLVEILRGFAHNIDGNWVLASEYAIANYTPQDTFNPDEQAYLVACRDLMLALLNRQTCQPSVLRANTSVGHLASEPFHNATGLPLPIVNEMLSAIAKPQGKFWSLKLPRDEWFCAKYPKIVSAAQKFWAARLVEAANTIQKFKNQKGYTVTNMVENIELKAQLTRLMRYRVLSDAKIKAYAHKLGFNHNDDTTNLQSLLQQIALPVNRSGDTFWVLKRDNVSLLRYKMACIDAANDNSYNIDSGAMSIEDIEAEFKAKRIPEFVFRRINKINNNIELVL